ncbi:DDE-type integrase/transposase/recombinase [Tessaracoccus sp. OH4464_COT-324]|uniref:DDE-type integrase/transposase/recombinase n=1 Tax=Tessaracoccus sp. OH4464_COT-324 TaxID=2491059 RepID=UPI001319F434|nr:DDE-type integrase/transposase/recombinase [Tessaracoccus sp. OH4464_COT-324]
MDVHVSSLIRGPAVGSHTVACVLLGVFLAGSARATGSSATCGLHGSLRLLADLRDDGWEVSEEAAADSMRRAAAGCSLGQVWYRTRQAGQGQACVTRPAPPQLHCGWNARWVGGMAEFSAAVGRLYLVVAIDLHSRCLLGVVNGFRSDFWDAIWREPEIERVFFRTGLTYRANSHTKLCRHMGIGQLMGRVGPCFDNAVAEEFFGTLG